MKHLKFFSLRMGYATHTPPIRLKMRSILLVLGLLLGSLNVWGDSPYEHLFTGSTTSPFGSAQSGVKTQNATLSGVSWTITTAQAASYFAQTTTTGLQVGSKANQSGNFTLSTSELNDYTITQVEVECSRATNSTATLSVTVGENALGTQNQSLGTTASALTFSNQTGYSGDIVLSFTNPTVNNKSTAVYIKRVTITYTTGGSSCETFAAPTNPSSTPAQTSVVLNWDAVANATGYKVVFDGTDYDIASGVTTKTIEDLAMETEYHWTVAAKGDGTTNCELGTATAQQSVTTLDACTANKAVYTVASTSSVTPSGALEGSSATFANTYTTKEQMTSGKKQTLTLSGYDGATIKGLTLSMRSNGSAGAGTFSLIIGSTPVAALNTATNFNNWFDNTTYGTTYRNVHVPFTEDVVVGTGEDIVVTIAATTNSLYCQSFSFCYEEPAAAAVEKPTFSVAGGSYLDAQSVEINCATAGADIYYTLDGADPSSASTPYSGAISISETKTLKAIAIKGSDASAIASATYTIVVPKSVDEIWNEITADGPTDAYVWGYVSQADVNGNNTYYISVNGSTEGNQLEIYKGDNDGHTISKGDKVVVNGDLTIWGSTKEFASGTGKVVRYNAKGAVTSVAVSGTATKTTYSANETFETAGLKVTATYANGFSEVVTEGITWGDDLTDHKVTESTTVHVTATVGGVISAAYGVAIVVSTKTLVSIALSADEFEVYQGLELPKPTVTATYSEGEPEDVTALAEFTGYNKNTPGEQTITVSYSFGTGDPIEETYTVTVKPIYNVELPASVAKGLIETAVGETESTEDMIVRGIVSHINDASNNVQTYWISDDGTRTNEVEIYKGKYLSGANFTTTNQLKVGDEVVVKGKVVYFNSATPEFANGKSQLQSLARTPNFEIEAVTGFEVGADDLAVEDLTITQDGEGEVTLAGSDKEEFVTIVDGKLRAVAAGTATITANLDANGIYKAKTTTFDVTVIAAQVKYAITFDGNGADGGEAPEAIADKAAGAEVTLPANAYTKTGHTFDGWKVFYVDDESVEHEVTISENAFTMPAFAVTIQAQWAEISEWAVKYTSNVTLTAGTGAQAAKVRFTADGEQYEAVKAGTSKAGGSITVTVPAQATKLHLHVAGWTGENPTISITAPEGVTVTPASISATEDEGMNSNSPFTLKNDPVDQYLVLSLSGNTEEIQLTFSTDAGNKRFALYGVNQEGGIVPVLDHIIVTGIATALEYEVGDVFNPAGLGANAIYTLGGVEQDPVAIDAEDIEWSFEPATIAANTTAVTVTATYEGESATKEVTGLTVSVPEPEIIVSAASLAFGNKAKGVAVDDKELTVTLKSVENATLTITGDGASAFSVTPAALTASETVAVSASTANVGTFNATLTISDDAGAAEAKTVALSITVEASDDLSGTWNLVTDAAELMAGMQVVITGVKNDNTYAMGAQANNNRTSVQGSLSGTVFTPAAGTKVFTLVDAGDGKFAIQTVDGQYLYAASGSANQLKTQTNVNDNSIWTISINEDNEASIVAESSSNRNVMRFNENNSNAPIFACYASASQNAIKLYAKAFDYSREIAQGVLSTTCLPNGGKICGASVFEIAYMDYEADGTTPHKIYFDEVEGGIMEAGMPYVVLANEGSAKFGVYYTDNENKSAQSKNGLVGYIGGGDWLNENDYFIYDNKFFFVSATDAANKRIHISNNRAYINLSDVPGYNNVQVVVPAPRRRVSLGNGNNAPQVATGVENVQGDNVQCTKVLINGQLFILRGEKMYDAKGQLVK